MTDVTYYLVLNYLIDRFYPIAGTLFAAAVFFHFMRWCWGLFQHRPNRAWLDAVLALALFILFYIRIPDPGAYLGMPSTRNFPESSPAIWLLERFSVGMDELIIPLLAEDATVQASRLTDPIHVTGEAGTQTVVPPPAPIDLIHNFIIARAQFIWKFAEGSLRIEPPTPPEGSDPDSPMGAWDFIKAMSSGEYTDYLVTQLATWIYALGALLGMLMAWGVLIVMALVLYLVAGLVRFVPIFLMAAFLLIFPFSYLFQGLRALKALASALALFLILKLVVVAEILVAFLILEALVIKGFLAVNIINPAASTWLTELPPGYLYTDAGAEALFLNAHAAQATDLSFLSLLVVLLALVYILIKTPALIMSLLGLQSVFDDFTLTNTFIAGTVVSLMKSRSIRASSSGGGSAPNQISAGK